MTARSPRQDTSGTIVEVNDRFCTLLQYARSELIGKDHGVVNSGYHPPEFFKKMRDTIVAGAVWRGEIKNRAKDGSVRWVAAGRSE
jgi:PAS domain S-box-containing protein